MFTHACKIVVASVFGRLGGLNPLHLTFCQGMVFTRIPLMSLSRSATAKPGRNRVKWENFEAFLPKQLLLSNSFVRLPAIWAYCLTENVNANHVTQTTNLRSKLRQGVKRYCSQVFLRTKYWRHGVGKTHADDILCKKTAAMRAEHLVPMKIFRRLAGENFHGQPPK
ncbi:MAG: hypothetical protein Q4F57_04360 [Weeksellaceae bacterium]|nr:hypothetical protein [Weeksellaceae bacterium]